MELENINFDNLGHILQGQKNYIEEGKIIESKGLLIQDSPK